jgi:hypothetical protein
MKRQQLTHWQCGALSVLVELDGTDLTISRKHFNSRDGEAHRSEKAETLALPASRSLLLSLREACDQALRRLR